MSSRGINPQINLKNWYYNDHLSTTFLILENDTKKKERGFVCFILAGFAKKGNDDRSEKKWGWRCILAFSLSKSCRVFNQ